MKTQERLARATELKTALQVKQAQAKLKADE
jgi:hypothetical protein